LAGFQKYWRRATPARISAADFFVPRVGIGFCAFWVVAGRLLMSLPGVSSIAAGFRLCSAPPRYPAFGPRPISNQMHLPIPVGPFGSRDDSSNPSLSATPKNRMSPSVGWRGLRHPLRLSIVGSPIGGDRARFVLSTPIGTGANELFARDGVIEQVGPSAELPATADTVLDLSGHILLPGMINCHHHLDQVLTRNLPAGQNTNLFPWLKAHYRIWAARTPEDTRSSA
jgi:hypothetical protein